LKRFVDRAQSGDVPPGSYLLVESLDRLSREEVIDALEFFLTLLRLGLTIVTIGDGENVYSRASVRRDQNKLLLSIITMIRAHEESSIKSERVASAWSAKREEARKSGQAMTSRCPGWLRLVDGPRKGRYEVIEDRAAIVKSWFEDTVAGIGRRTIARKMNASGISPWGVGGSQGEMWHDSYIQKTIGNPAVIGVFTPKAKLAGGADDDAEEPIKGYFPAIVDERTFWAAQIASKGRGMGKGNAGAKHRNVLRGLAKCEFCGSNMVYLDKGSRAKGPKLRCGRAHQSAGCEHRDLYGYKYVELTTIFAVNKQLSGLVRAAENASATADTALKIAVAQRDEKKHEMGRLLDIVQSGGDIPEVADRLKRLSAELSALEKEVLRVEQERQEAMINDPEKNADDLQKLFDSLRKGSPEDRVKTRAAMRERLTHLIDKVVIGPSGYVSHLKDGLQAKAVWVGQKPG